MEILGDLDFARLTGWDPLQGLTVSSAVRYRGGAGVNKWVGASRYFAPSNFQGGRLGRFLTAYLTYTTPQLFWRQGLSDRVKRLLHCAAGQQVFYQQHIQFRPRARRERDSVGRQLFGLGRLSQGQARRLVLRPGRPVFGDP